MEHPFAAGGLCSTVDDLIRWSDAFHGRRFLTEGSYQLMVNPTRLDGGRTVPYGFGLRIDTLHGSRVISHQGGINGFSGWLAYLAERNTTVAMLGNSASKPAEDLIAGVLNACAGGSPEL
jgi:CubicO group peptidase (beta-lactamase class C family)